MNVFALTLQSGPGTDVPVNREPHAEGFDRSLDKAMTSSTGAVSSEEEAALPEVQAEPNLDLNALDAENALSMVGVIPVPGMVLAVVPNNLPTEDPLVATLPGAITAPSLPVSPDPYPVGTEDDQPDLTLPEQLIVKSIEVKRSSEQPSLDDSALRAPNQAIASKDHIATVANLSVANSETDSSDASQNPIVLQPNVNAKGATTSETATEGLQVESLATDDQPNEFDSEGDSEMPRQGGNQHLPIHRTPAAGNDVFGTNLDQSAGVRDALRSMADRIGNTVELKPHGQVRILMDSLDLGSIMTTVNVDGHRVEAQVKVQDERLGMAMQAQRQELFHRIEARGMSLDNFHVGQENSSSNPHGQSNEEQFQQGQRQGQLITANAATADTAPTAAVLNWSPTTRWINTIA